MSLQTWNGLVSNRKTFIHQKASPNENRYRFTFKMRTAKLAYRYKVLREEKCERKMKQSAIKSEVEAQAVKRLKHKPMLLPKEFLMYEVARSVVSFRQVILDDCVSRWKYYCLSTACLRASNAFSQRILCFSFIRATVISRPRFLLQFLIFMLTVSRFILVTWLDRLIKLSNSITCRQIRLT